MNNLFITNPLALSFTIIMCVLVFFVKKNKILIPVIFLTCFITEMQGVRIFSMYFSMTRIIVSVGLLRFLIKNEQKSFKFNKIDKLVLLWGITRTIAHAILCQSFSIFMFSLGNLLDTLGAYFLIRLSLYDIDDYDSIIKTLIVSAIVISLFMVYEHKTGRNLFSIIGSVPIFSEVREGKIRAQGSFAHSILAGNFAATLLPLIWGLKKKTNKNKLLAFIGIISSINIVIMTASSGPIIALLCCTFGIFFWRYRKHTKRVLNLFYLGLFFLHLIMKAPVWFLIARIDLVGGSTGMHRALLIDNAIRRFSDWMVCGLQDVSYWGTGLHDMTNMYIYEGVFGGVIPFILFIMIIIYSFKSIGITRQILIHNLNLQQYSWSFGASLFGHIISIISVTYFGQIEFFYFAVIAMISSLNNLPSITQFQKKI